MSLWYLLLVPVISGLDRFRGDMFPEGWGGAKKLLLGVVMAFAMCLTDSLWVFILGSILSGASFASGWGTPLGAALGKHNRMSVYESYWQGDWFGWILRKNALAAMAARGAWGGLFLLPLICWNPWVVLMVPLLAISYSLPTLITTEWDVYELYRGGCIGISCLLVGFLN